MRAFSKKLRTSVILAVVVGSFALSPVSESVVVSVPEGRASGNDDFAQPFRFPDAAFSSFSASTAGNWVEIGEPILCSAAAMGATAWFSLRPTKAGLMTVDTRGSDFDTMLSAYTGSSLWALTQEACNDDDEWIGDFSSRIEFEVEPGAVYRIQAGGYNSNFEGPAYGNLIVNVTFAEGGFSRRCGGFAATIVGTIGNDNLRGTEGNDVIVGLGGNDTIDGKGGFDVICGGDGKDTILGGDGADWIFGGSGNDLLKGGQGPDYIEGGPGDDILRGQKGDDYLIGQEGFDKVRGGAGVDACQGEDVKCEWSAFLGRTGNRD